MKRHPTVSRSLKRKQLSFTYSVDRCLERALDNKRTLAERLKASDTLIAISKQQFTGRSGEDTIVAAAREAVRSVFLYAALVLLVTE